MFVMHLIVGHMAKVKLLNPSLFVGDYLSGEI